MPNKDGTGPRGMGALSGRGLGPCGGGMRRGCGRGFGYRRQVTLTEAEEEKILEADLKDIEVEKEAIQKRLKEMK